MVKRLEILIVHRYKYTLFADKRDKEKNLTQIQKKTLYRVKYIAYRIVIFFFFYCMRIRPDM